MDSKIVLPNHVIYQNRGFHTQGTQFYYSNNHTFNIFPTNTHFSILSAYQVQTKGEINIKAHALNHEHLRACQIETDL